MTTDSSRVYRSVKDTARFVYTHSISLVGVSLLWFIGSLPVLTVGISTLGAYSALLSLRDSGSIERNTVHSSLKSHWVNVTLFSWVVIIIASTTALYFYRYVVNGGMLYAIFCILGIYLLIFTIVMELTSFIFLEQNYSFSDAIRNSYLLLIANPLFSVSCLLLGAGILVMGVISIVGLVVIIPGLLFSFHIIASENTQQDMERLASSDPQ